MTVGAIRELHLHCSFLLSNTNKFQSILKCFQNLLPDFLVCFLRKVRVFGDDFKGVRAGLFEDGEIPDEVADLQLRQSMLARAEEFTRSS